MTERQMYILVDYLSSQKPRSTLSNNVNVSFAFNRDTAQQLYILTQHWHNIEFNSNSDFVEVPGNLYLLFKLWCANKCTSSDYL